MKQWVSALLVPAFAVFFSCSVPLPEDDQHEEIKRTITKHIEDHLPFLPAAPER
jgi:hypothetical protein